MLDNLLQRATGVLHVGANEGQERDLYHKHGVKVVWIEALPDVHAILANHIAAYPNQTSLQALCTDVPGQTYQFNIANDQGASSSIFNFAKHRDIWPTVDYVGKIDLVSTTLDELIATGQLDASGIDTLVLDTQGSELLVLKGAETLLKSIRYLKVEASDFEVYEGCAMAPELEKWLQSKRYRLIYQSVFAQHPSGGLCSDFYFELAVDDAAWLRVADEFQVLGNTIADFGMAEIGQQVSAIASAFDASVPEPDDWWSHPFNSQAGRTQVIKSLLGFTAFSAILETGTLRGSTTRFFAQHCQGPIHSCDSDARWVMTAQRKLKAFPNISVEQCDSRVFLARHLAALDGPLFIYLDAYRGGARPLVEELGLILESGLDVVVVIDDFAVPYDPGYSFDDYGPGKRLTTEVLAGIDPKGAALFFPTLHSSMESGAKRGCAIIATGSMIEAVTFVSGLKRIVWPQHVVVTPQMQLHINDTIAPIRRLLRGAVLEQNCTQLQAQQETLQRELELLQSKYDTLDRDYNLVLQQLQTMATHKATGTD